MIELMNASSIPIQTVAIGEVCSAGLIVAMSGTKGLRVVTPSCSIMSHNFSTTTSGSYHELKEANVELDKADRMIIDQYKKCTGLSEKVIRSKLVTPKDIYLTPADAVKYKLFDSVSPLKIGVLNNL
jgi:ATP-dependent Clp protease protease subunit